jgi:hypothetical protein
MWCLQSRISVLSEATSGTMFIGFSQAVFGFAILAQSVRAVRCARMASAAKPRMNATPPAIYDLAVIGGGINGAGIARDAAGAACRCCWWKRMTLLRTSSGSRSWSTAACAISGTEFLVAESLSSARGAPS